jgi:putative peptidoglycan lipid II flippase
VAGLAAFGPALLIAMLLHGLITVSLITALYTRLSEAAARGDSTEVMRYHHQGIRLPSVILVPGVVFVGVMAPYVAATLFFKNSLEQTRAIAVVLSGLIWLVIPMAWTYLNDRVFYAHQMTWMTFRLQCVSTGLSTVGALFAATLVPSLTAFALSIGQALAYVVTAAVGFWVLHRRHGHLGLRGTAVMYLKLAVPAVLTALALYWAIHTFLPDFGETRGFRGFAIGAVVLGVAGLVELGVTWGVAHALGVREIGAALEPATRRLRRR